LRNFVDRTLPTNRRKHPATILPLRTITRFVELIETVDLITDFSPSDELRGILHDCSQLMREKTKTLDRRINVTARVASDRSLKCDCSGHFEKTAFMRLWLASIRSRFLGSQTLLKIRTKLMDLITPLWVD
jgi:hypothetical protein